MYRDSKTKLLRLKIRQYSLMCDVCIYKNTHTEMYLYINKYVFLTRNFLIRKPQCCAYILQNYHKLFHFPLHLTALCI